MPAPRKRFGQHWLNSEKALARIITAAELQAGDRLLEIGPGKGALTRELLAAGAKVAAIEIDRDLCVDLSQRWGNCEDFLLLQGDILSLDWPGLLAPYAAFARPQKVVANIPYNLTGPILEHLLGNISQPRPDPFELIVLLVQREVALRLVARPGSSHYAGWSVRAGFLAECEFICDVPARAFFPPPKVDSAVIRLRPRPFVPAPSNPKRLESLLRLGFSSRRKMLRNNFKALLGGDRTAELLGELGLNPQARAEELSVADWVRLSDCVEALRSLSPLEDDVEADRGADGATTDEE